MDDHYKGWDEKHRWRCKNGHDFTKVWALVKKGYWCNLCNGIRTITYETLAAEAKKRVGRLISSKYIGYHESHLFECDQGHKWKAVPRIFLLENGAENARVKKMAFK